MSRDLTLLIPAAGHSTRFVDAGITTPKAEIRFRRHDQQLCRPMLQQVRECARGLDIRETIVATKPHQHPHVGGVHYVSVFDSKGQAHTVLQALAHVPDGEVLVVNCDQGFEGTWLHELVREARGVVRPSAKTPAREAEAAVLVFPVFGGDPIYSYVNPPPPEVHTTAKTPFHFQWAAEKIRISPWAIAGAFWFRDARRLASALAALLAEPYSTSLPPNMRPEPYLSEVFRYMHESWRGENLLAVPMDPKDLRQWGTPEDLANDASIAWVEPEVDKHLVKFRKENTR